jgi:hypothetical protein
MKSLRSILFVSAATLLLATAAVAQAQEAKVAAFIPFDFVVGDHAYPAGEYSLQSISGDGIVVRIESTDQVERSNVISHSCTGVLPATKTKMVFRQMGGNMFLYQVWIEGHLTGREFPKSHAEMRLAEDHEKAKVVIIAANISE